MLTIKLMNYQKKYKILKIYLNQRKIKLNKLEVKVKKIKPLCNKKWNLWKFNQMNIKNKLKKIRNLMKL